MDKMLFLSRSHTSETDTRSCQAAVYDTKGVKRSTAPYHGRRSGVTVTYGSTPTS